MTGVTRVKGVPWVSVRVVAPWGVSLGGFKDVSSQALGLVGGCFDVAYREGDVPLRGSVRDAVQGGDVGALHVDHYAFVFVVDHQVLGKMAVPVEYGAIEQGCLERVEGGKLGPVRCAEQTHVAGRALRSLPKAEPGSARVGG